MMPVISFVKNKAPLQVQAGENLMQALQQHDVPVASSCHGEGVCRKCVVTVVEGFQNLTPATLLELDLAERSPINPDQRISCQAQVKDDIKIDTGYW